MASINDLKGYVSKKLGIAQSNQFAVTMPGARFLDKREVNVLCKNVTLPGKQITTIDKTIGIYNEKVANGFLVDDVSMTFHVLNDYGVKNYFDLWTKMILGTGNEFGDGEIPYPKGTVRYKSDYTRNIRIHQLAKPIARFGFDVGPLDIDFDLFGGAIYSVELIDAFPTTFNAIELTNELDGLVEINVQFSYTDWRVIPSSRSLIGGSTNFNFGSII